MLHISKPQTNHSILSFVLTFALAFFLQLISRPLHAQSQVEIENEMSVGDSDAAMAEEKQIQARLQEDNAKEEEAKHAAATSYEATKKKTASVHAHIEQMKISIVKANKNRQNSLTEIAIDQKKLNKLDKKESEFKASLTNSQNHLDATIKKHDQLLSQIKQTKDQTQKTKEEIASTKGKEFIAKSEVKSAVSQLSKSKNTLAETKKWRNKEAKRIAQVIKNLNRDQATIENKIKLSSAQIKRLQDEVNILKKKNAIASENHERAAALKNENDLELARLQKLKRVPASVVTPLKGTAKQAPSATKSPATSSAASTSN